MNLEDKINGLNEHFFFKEFTYSKNTFKRPDGQEVEIADSIVYLDEISFIFQLKERNNTFHSTEEKERKWFKKKVLKLATKQIRDTVSYIRDYKNVVLSNNKGHSIDISLDKLKSPHKIVIHKSSELLPQDCQNTKFHISDSVGIIHIVQEHDYLGLVHYLLTPSEVFEYFLFRGMLVYKHGNNVNSIPEPALLGQYLAGDEESSPSVKFMQHIAQLNREVESWDMTGIIKLFPDRMVGEGGATDYYFIVKEIAKLMRNELSAFKQRFMLSWNAAKGDESVLPYRFLVPRCECSFLFLPLPRSEKENRRDALINFTYANKYDLKSTKAIGASFVASGDGWQDVEWCYIESPWVQDDEFDKVLRENYPFREVKEKRIGRYGFD
ncbi:hypothetical protein [Microbulbifer sp. YPW1]|uniref:hypothetical protein n=1 Tax=Microbulbifer sp. YPW1 TaxID=2745199 RepID=UPI0015992C95|nr:hypothetical protein [Microbulbifer sp. YPW1]QKX18153.1 hypothetical protein HUW35_14925 [Microbulbifer sp. YPW1]